MQVYGADKVWKQLAREGTIVEPIGYIPPAEAEANYYRHLASQVTMVAA